MQLVRLQRTAHPTVPPGPLAQRYRLRLVDGHPVEPRAAVTLRPRYGVQVALHPTE